jgi:hypothetical protein
MVLIQPNATSMRSRTRWQRSAMLHRPLVDCRTAAAGVLPDIRAAIHCAQFLKQHH